MSWTVRFMYCQGRYCDTFSLSQTDPQEWFSIKSCKHLLFWYFVVDLFKSNINIWSCILLLWNMMGSVNVARNHLCCISLPHKDHLTVCGIIKHWQAQSGVLLDGKGMVSNAVIKLESPPTLTWRCMQFSFQFTDNLYTIWSNYVDVQNTIISCI